MVGSERNRLSNIISNMESISENFKNNNDKINHILSNLDTLSSDLAQSEIRQSVDNAKNAMAQVEEITQKINQGEGSLGLLLNDQELYENLSSASASLDQLIKDLTENPGKYLKISIFGKKDTK